MSHSPQYVNAIPVKKATILHSAVVHTGVINIVFVYFLGSHSEHFRSCNHNTMNL